MAEQPEHDDDAASEQRVLLVVSVAQWAMHAGGGHAALVAELLRLLFGVSHRRGYVYMLFWNEFCSQMTWHVGGCAAPPPPICVGRERKASVLWPCHLQCVWAMCIALLGHLQYIFHLLFRSACSVCVCVLVDECVGLIVLFSRIAFYIQHFFHLSEHSFSHPS